METLPGAIRTRQARTKRHRTAMNGMVCRMKMGKMIRIHGRAVIQINDIRIVKDLETIVHLLQNHRKYFQISNCLHLAHLI